MLAALVRVLPLEAVQSFPPLIFGFVDWLVGFGCGMDVLCADPVILTVGHWVCLMIIYIFRYDVYRALIDVYQASIDVYGASIDDVC